MDRVVGKTFRGLTFAFSAAFPQAVKLEDQLEFHQIRKLGGKIYTGDFDTEEKLSVDYILTLKGLNTRKIKEGLRRNIRVLNLRWITWCAKHRVCLKPDAFDIFKNKEILSMTTNELARLVVEQNDGAYVSDKLGLTDHA